MYIPVYVMFKKEVPKFNSKLNDGTFRDISCIQTRVQRFVNEQKEKTKIFLRKNPHVRIFPADKGGKIVITDVDTYDVKMSLHINQCVKKGTYSVVLKI